MTKPKHKVLWTKTAQNDMNGIVEFIAQDSVPNFKNVLLKVKKKQMN